MDMEAQKRMNDVWLEDRYNNGKAVNFIYPTGEVSDGLSTQLKYGSYPSLVGLGRSLVGR
jgi:hypothetical protein